MNIYELDKRTTDPSYINRIASLHVKAFPEFFLTQLGKGFLSTLYKGYLEDQNSGIIVAEDEKGRLLGFIAYSRDYSRFYKGQLKKHLLKFAICSAGAAIHHPSFIKRLLGAFHKSDEVQRSEAYVELASICVNPKAGGHGVGSELIDYLKSITDFNKYSYISLETDAEGNDSVNAFYIKNGFVLDRSYTTSAGRKMNEYHYSSAIDKAENLNQTETRKPVIEHKKIWIFCHYAQQPPYNTMLRYHNWGKQLVKRGYDVTIVTASTVHNTDIDVVDEIGRTSDTVDGVKYVYFITPKYSGNGMQRVQNMMSYSTQLKTMRAIELPDCIIVCEAYLYWFAHKYFKSVPIITDTVDLWPESIVSYTSIKRNSPAITALYKVEEYAYRHSDALIFSMEGGKQYLQERKYSNSIDYSHVFHINMGCDLEEFDRNAANESAVVDNTDGHFIITYSGSMRQANYVIQICDAAEILQNKSSNIEIRMYGNGSDEEQAKQYCSDNHLNNIHFYGRFNKADIPNILGASDANIMTYVQSNVMRYGGSQQKLFDYLASGKPVINCGTWGYNLISHYNCGVVDEKQTAESMADAMLKLSKVPKNELEAMGKRAREVAEMYDQPKLVDQLEKVLDSVMG